LKLDCVTVWFYWLSVGGVNRKVSDLETHLWEEVELNLGADRCDDVAWVESKLAIRTNSNLERSRCRRGNCRRGLSLNSNGSGNKAKDGS
jgi:hypothetical protein